MYRSFSNRVLGGVCGGIGEMLRINPWLLRVLFVVLTVASAGFGGLIYLALWWALPQYLPTRHSRRSFFGLLTALIVIGVMSALWLGRDMAWLYTSQEQSLFLPLVFLVLSAVFLLRQVRV